MTLSPLRTLLFAFLAVFLLLPRTPAWAMDGLALAQKMYDRDDGNDTYAIVRMLLIDKGGHRRMRNLISATKDFGGLSKSYMRFTSPEAIKDTAFLTWENEKGDDDQFLYLPALRRVRRIVSRQKDGQFVNTDYTYEDMQKRKVEKDNHKILGTENFQEYDCWILESTPKDPNTTQYGKVVQWVIKDIHFPAKIEYYDKRGRLKKVFYARDIKVVDGYHTVMESEMHDVQRDHRTFMRIDTIRYNTNIPDRIFTQRYLENPD